MRTYREIPKVGLLSISDVTYVGQVEKLEGEEGSYVVHVGIGTVEVSEKDFPRRKMVQAVLAQEPSGVGEERSAGIRMASDRGVR